MTHGKIKLHLAKLVSGERIVSETRKHMRRPLAILESAEMTVNETRK